MKFAQIALFFISLIAFSSACGSDKSKHSDAPPDNSRKPVVEPQKSDPPVEPRVIIEEPPETNTCTQTATGFVDNSCLTKPKTSWSCTMQGFIKRVSQTTLLKDDETKIKKAQSYIESGYALAQCEEISTTTTAGFKLIFTKEAFGGLGILRLEFGTLSEHSEF